jgi:hypothetical protein
MTEDQLRAIVREEIARQLAAVQGSAVSVPSSSVFSDPSHARFSLPNADGGLCVIEPRVMCTHCGFCKSYGH